MKKAREADQPDSFLKIRFAQRIDDLLDLASHDPIAAKAEARRLPGG